MAVQDKTILSVCKVFRMPYHRDEEILSEEVQVCQCTTRMNDCDSSISSISSSSRFNRCRHRRRLVRATIDNRLSRERNEIVDRVDR